MSDISIFNFSVPKKSLVICTVWIENFKYSSSAHIGAFRVGFMHANDHDQGDGCSLIRNLYFSAHAGCSARHC